MITAEHKFASDMQALLVGAPRVVVGFRDYHGQLTAVQEFETQTIPALVQGKVSS